MLLSNNFDVENLLTLLRADVSRMRKNPFNVSLDCCENNDAIGDNVKDLHNLDRYIVDVSDFSKCKTKHHDYNVKLNVVKCIFALMTATDADSYLNAEEALFVAYDELYDELYYTGCYY